jgi:hypothetical protein
MGHELSQESATQERAADHRDIIPPKRSRKAGDKGLDSARIGEEGVEIEPEPTMMPGLETEMTPLSCH